MMKNIKKYMTTAEVAYELGASIGTVQKLASNGAFETVRTEGGHRRILVDSFDKYKKDHGYSTIQSGDLMCIFHQGDDLDSNLIKTYDPKKIQFMSHPLDLLGIENRIACLFIDARNYWIKSISKNLVLSLEKKYKIFIYNSQKLQFDSNLFEMNNIHLIPQSINHDFIEGYRAGCTIGRPQGKGPARFDFL